MTRQIYSNYWGQNHDMGFAGLCGADDDQSNHLDWSKNIVSGFGAHVGSLGYVWEQDKLPPVEVSDDDITTQGFGGYVRTPVLELGASDYQQFVNTGEVPDQAIALGDDGELYQYSGLDGFFKRLFKRVRKAVKKVRSKIRKKIRGLLKRTRFGRILLKVHDRVVGVMMKIVKPLAKVVGKWASKLAPIAAIIPGYGTAVAGALLAAGKIANVMNKYGGVIRDVVSPPGDGHKKEIKHKKLYFASKGQEHKFKAALKAEAEQMKVRPKQELLKIASRLKTLDPAKHSRSNAVDDNEADRMVAIMKKARAAMRARRSIRAAAARA